MPRYNITEAARYLGVPESTLRSWFEGTTYGKKPHIKRFLPILIPASPDLLSFYDIASAHVLMAFKSKGVSTESIRDVVKSFNEEFPNHRYPLLGRDFHMFGKNVVIKRLGLLLNLTKRRQLGIKEVMERYLARLEFDADKMAVRFSPLRVAIRKGVGYIVIDPEMSGGRPVMRGTGIPAEVIAKRRNSGESVRSLAKDYRLSRRAIQEAIKYLQEAA
jgi:uncharacterized protein (DUF433 family)